MFKIFCCKSEWRLLGIVGLIWGSFIGGQMMYSLGVDRMMFSSLYGFDFGSLELL
jgi:hypothetical protein